jgi:hypothetical protein
MREDLRNEFDALLPGHGGLPTRRAALKAALGVGSAAAAAPLIAQTAIRTRAEGLSAGETTYEVGIPLDTIDKMKLAFANGSAAARGSVRWPGSLRTA